MAPLQILSICGSPRPTSRVRAGLLVLRDALAQYPVQNTLWDLGRNPLPFMDPDERGIGSARDPGLRHYLELAKAADGFILGSPIYHNSYSGWLKNALDHLSTKELGGKVFALTSHGGNHSPQAVDHLRIVVRSVQGIAIPTQLCTGEEDFATDEEGELHLNNRDTLARIQRLALELVEFTALFRARHEGGSPSRS